MTISSGEDLNRFSFETTISILLEVEAFDSILKSVANIDAKI